MTREEYHHLLLSWFGKVNTDLHWLILHSPDDLSDAALLRSLHRLNKRVEGMRSATEMRRGRANTSLILKGDEQ